MDLSWPDLELNGKSEESTKSSTQEALDTCVFLQCAPQLVDITCIHGCVNRHGDMGCSSWSHRAGKQVADLLALFKT